MRFIFIFFLLIFVTSGFAQVTLDSVITRYFISYTNLDAPYLLQFEKKKDGWYVARLNTTGNDDHTEVQQFWSREANAFLPITYPIRVDTTAAAIQEDIDWYSTYIHDYARTMYGSNPFYGYKGWDWDIIQQYQDSAILPDALLESLARAYSSYAIGFFMDQFGYHFLNGDPDRMAVPDSMTISISKKEKFILYETKSIHTFNRLRQQNPAYLTRVGTIDIKMTHEQIFAWSNLLFAGYEKDAVAFLNNASYPDSLLDVARGYFNSLDQNAIFIASGDNDTYPLWYLQQKHGYRKDVTVLNYNLLALRRMLQWLNKTVKPAVFSTPRALYMKKSFDYSLLENDSCTKSVFMNKLATNFFEKEKVRYYRCSRLVKPVSATLSKKVFKGIKLSGNIQVQLSHILFMSDYLLLDIIEKNFYSRPIYFSWREQFPPIADYLKETGSVYQLIP